MVIHGSKNQGSSEDGRSCMVFHGLASQITWHHFPCARFQGEWTKTLPLSVRSTVVSSEDGLSTMVCVALHGLALAGLLSAYHSLNSLDFMPKLQPFLAIYNFLSNLNSFALLGSYLFLEWPHPFFI